MNICTNLAVAVLILASTAMVQEQPARPGPPITNTSSNTQQRASTSSKGHCAELKWNASPTKDIDGYYIYRASGRRGKLKRITPKAVKETEYKDFNVRAGKTYTYAITAVKTVQSQVMESAFTPSVVIRVPKP